MTTLHTTQALRDMVACWKRDRLTIGIVPTMGALHDGHLSLIRRALSECDRVIVSIFVNPTQFNNAHDLKNYPRTELEDANLLREAGVHVLFNPDAAEMYPAGFATNIHIGGVSEGLCGAFRPGHFDGVATVVAKLLLQSQADRAFFGEKDFQQLHVVRRLAVDLNIPVQIIGCPTLREADGLAMSSRNRRLGVSARMTAGRLPTLMQDAIAALESGNPVAVTIDSLRQSLQRAGFDTVEYVELRREADLSPAENLAAPSRLLVAAWLSDIRLIDNMPVRVTQ